MTRTIRVKGKTGKGFDRLLPSGEKTHVKPFNREIADNPKLEVLNDEWAEKFIKDDLQRTHPDYVNVAKTVFVKPNILWAQNRAKFDVLGLDCTDVPEYPKVPETGLTNQIIKVKGKYYVCNKNGIYRRHFPPEIENLKNQAIKETKAKYNEDYKKEYGKSLSQAIHDNSSQDKKNIAEFQDVKMGRPIGRPPTPFPEGEYKGFEKQRKEAIKSSNKSLKQEKKEQKQTTFGTPKGPAKVK